MTKRASTVSHATALLIALAVATSAPIASAQETGLDGYLAGKTAERSTQQVGFHKWMHKDVKKAWSQGYYGQKVTVTVVDDFKSDDTLTGALDGVEVTSTLGYFTRKTVDMHAPLADIRAKDWTQTDKKVGLKKGLNVVNAGYWVFKGGSAWDAQNASIIKHATEGKAVVVKSAGDYGKAVGDLFWCNTCETPGWRTDQLATALVGSKSAIFVGALEKHGTTNSKAKIAISSNFAGTNKKVQKRFLVVGVDTSKHGFGGTNLAAPIISGYSAILGSKFKGASATQISNQLLSTARTDTILSYNKAIHGMGEACLSCALAPKKIK